MKKRHFFEKNAHGFWGAIPGSKEEEQPTCTSKHHDRSLLMVFTMSFGRNHAFAISKRGTKNSKNTDSGDAQTGAHDNWMASVDPQDIQTAQFKQYAQSSHA